MSETPSFGLKFDSSTLVTVIEPYKGLDKTFSLPELFHRVKDRIDNRTQHLRIIGHGKYDPLSQAQLCNVLKPLHALESLHLAQCKMKFEHPNFSLPTSFSARLKSLSFVSVEAIRQFWSPIALREWAFPQLERVELCNTNLVHLLDLPRSTIRSQV